MHSYQHHVKQPENKTQPKSVVIAAVGIDKSSLKDENRKPQKAQEQLYLWGKTGILKDFVFSFRWCIKGLGTDYNLKFICRNKSELAVNEWQHGVSTRVLQFFSCVNFSLQ